MGGGVLLGFYCVSNAFVKTEAGMTYVVQNQITGDLNVYKEPGIHPRVPFFSTVTPYRHVITASFGETTNSLLYLFNNPDPVKVRFADTYKGEVPCTFRFRLSQDDDAIRQMHKDFRSEGRLAETLLARNCKHVVVITATQYTGEEFFQGGLNEFKEKLEDQLKHGIYKTERKQVAVEKIDIAPIPDPLLEKTGAVGRTPSRLSSQQEMVWKTTNVFDKNGLPIRAETPLEQYGITVTQVTVGDPQPESLLSQLLIDKKRLVGARIKAVQEQDTAQAEAKTAQVVKNIERTKAVQDAQREKELAIIFEQRAVEVAKQIAEKQKVEANKLKELAVIDKTKELEIAQSNKEIFKANAEAAKYNAIAIRAKGEAEAAVLAAKYRALGANKEIYLAEMKRDTAALLYNNLNKFTVEMPQNYVNGDGAGRLTTNLDVITSFAALGLMNETT